MCGIFFSLNISDFIFPAEETFSLLRNRGPDCIRDHTLQLPYACSGSEGDSPFSEEPSSLFLTFVSTVLDLRGDHIQPQPIVDNESESVLCWNGEAWKIGGELVRGNDARRVFGLFLEALSPPSDEDEEEALSKEESLQKLANAISSISGPYSFVFFDGFYSRVIYGRDSLGRRSLLRGWDEPGAFKICSVCDETFSNHFDEVETDGLHVIELAGSFREFTSVTSTAGDISHHTPKIETIPWGAEGGTDGSCSLGNPIPPMNKALPEATAAKLTLASPPVAALEENLRKSLALRIKNIPEPPFYAAKKGAKLAVLFSGGLDCTVLAKLSHELLPIEEPIDLLNVAFENPRRVAAAEVTAAKSKEEDISNNDPISAYEECPDRITGRSSLAELQDTCPNRTWRFIAINIPYTETLSHREEIKRLMRPHNTEMDLSIACALYFAARGQGEVSPSPTSSSDTTTPTPTPYTSTARVLLSGLGADELFAGYTRHTLAFTRQGFEGLISELDLDVNRLGKRNLGRDDRIIAHWGREVRFPYLDEEFLSWSLRLPVWEKCGFSNSPTPPTSAAAADEKGQETEEITIKESKEPNLEPSKKILRLLAWKLGMEDVAREKKRAIQFGARTAKMEVGSGRCNGSDVLSS